MQAAVEAGLAEGLADHDLDPLLDFFTSDRGQRIIDFEVTARKALMDEDIEAVAEDANITTRLRHLSELRTASDTTQASPS